MGQGKYLVSAGDDTQIRVWDHEKGKCIHQISTDNPITKLCFDPNTHQILAVADEKVQRWIFNTEHPQFQSNDKVQNRTLNLQKALFMGTKGLPLNRAQFIMQHGGIVRLEDRSVSTDNKQTIDYSNKVLKIACGIVGEKHACVAINYNNLGTAYRGMGNNKQAIEYYQKALKVFHAFDSKDLELVATVHNNLSESYRIQGKYGEAIQHSEKALAMWETLDPNHFNRAIAYNILGTAYNGQGAYDKAIQSYQKALAIWKTWFGLDYPDIASVCNNLAVAYDNKHMYGEAIEFYQMALAIRLPKLGPNHPGVATIYNNLGTAYDQKGGCYDEAIAYYQEVLEIWEPTLGCGHPKLVTVYNNLSAAYERKGEYDKATKYGEKSLAILEKASGDVFFNIERANIYNSLAIIYHSQGEYKKAIRYLHPALTIWQSMLGLFHSLVATVYNNLGRAHIKMGEYDQAYEYLKRSLRIYQIQGGIHLDMAYPLDGLGTICCKQGNCADAIKYHTRALYMRKKYLDEDHPDMVFSFNYLGEAYQAQEDHATAATYFEQALQIREAKLGPNHPDTQETRTHLTAAQRNIQVAHNSGKLLQHEITMNREEVRRALLMSMELNIDKDDTKIPPTDLQPVVVTHNFGSSLFPLLYAACIKGEKEKIQHLITQGVHVNATFAFTEGCYAGYTVLHFACVYGHVEVVQWLIGQNANVNAMATQRNNASPRQDNHGTTPLHEACGNGHLPIVQLLLANSDINVNIQDEEGDNCFNWACGKGRAAVIHCLLKDGRAETTCINRHGYNALHFCAAAGSVESMTLLLQQPSLQHLATQRNVSGQIPRDLARAKGHQEIVQLLMPYADSSDPQDADDEDLQRALAMSMENDDHEDVVERLHSEQKPSSND